MIYIFIDDLRSPSGHFPSWKAKSRLRHQQPTFQPVPRPGKSRGPGAPRQSISRQYFPPEHFYPWVHFSVAREWQTSEAFCSRTIPWTQNPDQRGLKRLQVVSEAVPEAWPFILKKKRSIQNQMLRTWSQGSLGASVRPDSLCPTCRTAQ